MNKIIQIIIQWTWGLPQNIIGLIIHLFLKSKGSKYRNYNHAIVTGWKSTAGLSLGMYIFVNENYIPKSENISRVIKHEYGHSIQSLITGWLYLIVVGLPSLIWASCFDWYRRKYNVSYYEVYPENWAEKLGGNIS